MAGIYIHIPFCKKRCAYCDFYTEVAPQLITSLVNCIVKELHIRCKYLKDAPVSTIYFGGGTPSILNRKQFGQIFDAIFELFVVDKDAEITFEANPDDLSPEYFQSIADLPFNRISIGIQSFDDADLKRINRRHTGNEAVRAVKNAQQAGFANISIDLIYGLPSQTPEAWERQLDRAMSLNIQHLSAYGLTYEEGTPLWQLREKGNIKAVDDDTMNLMYMQLLDKIQQYGYEAYEISNFALPGFRSRHNTAYWQHEPYLGVGPSAHSYDLDSRQWNVASISAYIRSIEAERNFFEIEKLTTKDKYNDYVMVSLRTSDGIDLKYLEREFGTETKEFCLQNIKSFIEAGRVVCVHDKLRLTLEGIMISNLILIELMRV